ncbi:helix-turn-helix domain-containing protein [Paenibacillus daejeonensis]|uniref:helix-turn-helix domain-containing protein n=1 Tax=Paenibacillus daejeonensis TaxID=135193 RepID=UPI000375330A|nr:helix-turn-helix domain-containing protein [Paenibacillus daejeonensis]
MYKVLLADDHLPVLEVLESCIPWTELNLELIGACSDGQEAWEACQAHQPDILLTDIGMPVMDGLSLIEKAKSVNPQLQAIILSCHEEFHYAQKAVKLNVSDYILKESLEIEHVQSVLVQAVSRLDAEKTSQHSLQKLQKMVENNYAVIRSRFIRSFLEQPVWDEGEWVEQAANMGIKLRRDIPYLPVAAFPDQSYALEQRFGGAVNMQFVLDNALQEAFAIEDSILFSHSERHYILLLPFPRTIVRNMHEELRQAMRRAQQSLADHLRVSISFFYGQPEQALSQLKKQIQFLLASQTLRFYAGQAAIHKAEVVTTASEDLFIHYAYTLQELRDCIQDEDAARAETFLNKLSGELQTRKYPVESLKSWILKMVLELELKYTVMQQFVTNFDSQSYQHSLGQLETLEELMAWFKQFMAKKISGFHAMQPSLRKEVAEAQRYVLTHLNEKISMDAVAKQVGLNPTHFSRIFKLDTGSTFVEFVTRSKMERACELLNQTTQTVIEIADQLGYDNPSYFIKLFRNHTDKSPAEYRKSI